MSDVSSDKEREELLWTATQESLLAKWKTETLTLKEKHDLAAMKNKRRYQWLGVIALLVPTTLSGITQIIDNKLLVSLGFITSGILNGIRSLFNFEGLYVKHSEFSSKYEDFARDLDAEMIKPKSLRRPCDVFITECRLGLNSLTRRAPEI